MADPDQPHLLDLLEKYVTTVLAADAFVLLGLYGARTYQRDKDLLYPLTLGLGGVGLVAIFAIAAILNIWALLRAEKDFENWGKERSGWERVIGFLSFSLVFVAQLAVGFHVGGLIGQPLE